MNVWWESGIGVPLHSLSGTEVPPQEGRRAGRFRKDVRREAGNAEERLRETEAKKTVKNFGDSKF